MLVICTNLRSYAASLNTCSAAFYFDIIPSDRTKTTANILIYSQEFFSRETLEFPLKLNSKNSLP